MNSSKLYRVWLLLIIGAFLIYGCGANRPEISTDEGVFEKETQSQDQADIDELFGIINESETRKTEEAASDDEVLELLGISKKQNEQADISESDKSEDQLQKEIEMLESRLAEKNAEISDLKSNVQEKDEVINRLEGGVAGEYDQPSGQMALSGDYKADYEQALQQYYNRNYKQAIQMFEELLAKNFTHSLSDNCRYWIGESYYGLGNYNQAIIEFTKVFSFSKSNKMDDSQLKLGLCYWRLGDRDRAIQELERLISDYPDSEYVDKAQQFIARLE